MFGSGVAVVPFVCFPRGGAGAGGSAANQNLGYWRWILLTRRETSRRRVDESSRTGRKYHRSAQIPGSTQGIKAVAPAGGCVVLVTCITMSAMAVEREAASHCR
jgi:hypothetical protein